MQNTYLRALWHQSNNKNRNIVEVPSSEMFLIILEGF